MSASPPGMRAADVDRARVVSLLQRHFADGRLTVEELEDRTRRAYVSRTLGELDALMADLPPPAAPAGAATRWGLSPLPPGVARYVAVMLLLVGIWALSGRGYFWPAWPMLGWGCALVCRTLRHDGRLRPRER